MAEIKTRILLRNDTIANWDESTITLKKGEVAIAMLNGNLAEVRIGNNTSWANSKKIKVEAGQISGLTSIINTQISSLAQEYQLTAGTGDDLNKWFLQSRALSGGDWTTIDTVDLTQLTGYALSADVDALVAAVSAEAILSSKSYTDEQIAALSIENYMLTATFNAISNDIGLSAASSSNKVVTQDDIADLAGAMHFRGAVTPTEGQSDADAIAAYYASEGLTPEAGDIVIVTTTSKEYVCNGTAWVELGDEVLYAKKTDVDELVNATSVALSTDYVNKIDDLSTSLETLVGTVSAEAILSANAYTDEQIAALSIGNYIEHGKVTSDELSGFFVLDCGDSTYRTGEYAATEA